MVKKLFICIIFAFCMGLGMNATAAEQSATCSIYERNTEKESEAYSYHGVPLSIRVSDVNNFWWTGREYLLMDYETKAFSKSYDLKDWEKLDETDGLEQISKHYRNTYSINYYGDKYLVLDREYENAAAQLEFVDRGIDFSVNKLLILDDAFNVLKEIEMDSPISTASYVDGKYYMQTQDCTNYKSIGNPENTVYVSDDALTWTIDESLSEVPLSVDSRYSLLFNGALTDGKGPYLQNIISLVDNDGVKTNIKYEKVRHNYVKSADNLYISYGTSQKNTDVTAFQISVDGIYWITIDYPEFLRSCDVNTGSASESYVESVYNFMNLKDKILFQTQYRLFEYDKKELADIWYEAFGNDPVYIKLSDSMLAFEQPPVISDDRTLIPLRFLFEQMGAEVTWNQEEQTATITQDNTAITVGIDDTEAEVNGQTVSMDVPAQLINDKTMVPVRFLSEQLGYDVSWDGENRIITIE